MVAQDRNQRMGFAFDAGNPYTDPINSGTAAYWKFGRLSKDFKEFEHPWETHNWRALYTDAARTPSELELIGTNLSHGLAFYPTNLIPYYMILGKHEDPAGGDEHKITAATSGELPSFTTRSESTDGDEDDKILAAIGCKALQLSTLINLRKGFGKLSHTFQYSALTSLPNDSVNPSHTTKHTTGTKYPTQDGAMTGTEVKNQFRKDSNFAFVWDSADSADNLTSHLAEFNFVIEKLEEQEDAENKEEPDFIADGNYILGLSFTVTRTGSKVLFDDFNARTQHDSYFTINAGATNYQKITWDDIGLTKPRMGYPFEGQKTYIFQGIAEGIEIRGIDGVHQATFYGE